MADDVLFMVQVDLDSPLVEDEFNAWYNDEHIPELLRVPGFATGRRFRAIEGQPRYAAMYELSSIAALNEPLFHQARPAHPKSTPATRKMWPHVRNLRRGIYSRVSSSGDADATRSNATHLLLRGLDFDAGAETSFRTWCARNRLSEAKSARGVASTSCYALDPRSTDHKDP